MAIELVLGLGNPGPEYAATRHNAGFMVADELRRRRGAGDWVVVEGCEAVVLTPGRLVVAARPLGYMNRSGTVAAGLLQALEIAPTGMLVVVDDVDLPLGRLRLRPDGGPGSHNGLRDLCRAVGDSFPRLRVGVGGGRAAVDLADFVLSPFAEDEREAAAEALRRAADAVEQTLREGLQAAMNRFNRAPEPRP